MSQRIFIGKIRKVSAGPNPKDCIAHSVGQIFSIGQEKFEIVDLELSEFLYEKYGKIAILVWVRKAGTQDECSLYKTFVDVPLTLCSDVE